jgi:hypothetical protein
LCRGAAWEAYAGISIHADVAHLPLIRSASLGTYQSAGRAALRVGRADDVQEIDALRDMGVGQSAPPYPARRAIE